MLPKYLLIGLKLTTYIDEEKHNNDSINKNKVKNSLIIFSLPPQRLDTKSYKWFRNSFKYYKYKVFLSIEAVLLSLCRIYLSFNIFKVWDLFVCIWRLFRWLIFQSTKAWQMTRWSQTYALLRYVLIICGRAIENRKKFALNQE